MDDHELLEAYVRSQSQEAFRELVDRHLPMVHATARRVLGDAQLAEDVAQGVFTTLAQKAAGLAGSCVVGGWLYHTTRNLALHTLRTEHRRRVREQAAVALQSIEASFGAERILEFLEPAIAELEDGERDALVLRFLEDRSLREVGGQLGISEDAARMRVSRALEHLRIVFAHRGIAVTSVILATAMGAATTEAVPAGLAATITALALAVKSAATVTAAAAVHAEILPASSVFAKATATALGVALLASTGAYLFQHRQMGRLRAQNGALLAQQRSLTAELESAAQQTQARQQELERLQGADAELLRLRNEVTQLRRTQASAGSGGQIVSPDKLIWSLDPQAFAQNPPIVFIRPSPEPSTGAFGMSLTQQGTIALRTSFTNIVAYAYDVGPSEFNRILLPADAPQGWFDFIDTVPQGRQEAMRQLLKDQYGLVAKRETRPVETLLLTLDRAEAPGLKLSTEPGRAGSGAEPGAVQMSGRTIPSQDGTIAMQATYELSAQPIPRQEEIRGEGTSMGGLAAQLQRRLGRAVVDQTGLTERYDYELLLAPDASLEHTKKKLSDRLGLGLTAAEGGKAVEFLVVEKVR